jgi:hypothetical protein
LNFAVLCAHHEIVAFKRKRPQRADQTIVHELPFEVQVCNVSALNEERVTSREMRQTAMELSRAVEMSLCLSDERAMQAMPVLHMAVSITLPLRWLKMLILRS